jgi:hypothetical protein
LYNHDVLENKQTKGARMKKFIAVAVAVATAAVLTGCQLIKPTPDGECPKVTTIGAYVVSFAGARAALDKGAPVAILSSIESNINVAVVTGKFNVDVIDLAIANSGGAKWATYLAGVSILFRDEMNTVVNTNVNKQVCVVPVLKNISLGINQAIAVNPKPALVGKGVPASEQAVQVYRSANQN